MEGLQIALGVVGDALFPAGKKDAYPFEGHRAQRGMMAFALGALGLIMGAGPAAVADGTPGEFVKGLAEKLGTSLAEADAGLFFALFAALLTAGAPYRGNSI